MEEFHNPDFKGLEFDAFKIENTANLKWKTHPNLKRASAL